MNWDGYIEKVFSKWSRRCGKDRYLVLPQSKGGIIKISALRKHLKGWARHMVGQLKNEKFQLSSIIDELEAIAEVRSLSTQEIDLKKSI